MKWFLVCLLCVFVFASSCAKFIKPQKVEISDGLLQELSEDLAEIGIMVEAARRELDKEKMIGSVVISWRSPRGLKYKISTPNEPEEVYSVLV